MIKTGAKVVDFSEERGLAFLTEGITSLRVGQFDRAKGLIHNAQVILNFYNDKHAIPFDLCSDLLDYITRAA